MNPESYTLPVTPQELHNGPACTQTLQGFSHPQTLARGEQDPFNLLKWLWSRVKQVRVRHIKKRLRVCETLPLGEKRFIAVIQVDEKQFLVGGSTTSISLLAELQKPVEFATVLQNRVAEIKAQA